MNNHLTWLAWLVLVTPVQAQTIYSDDQLLAEGKRAYERKECLRAMRFLFAYQQRDTPLMRQDTALRGSLSQAIAACEAYVAAGTGGAGTEGKVDDVKGIGATAATPKPLPKLRLQGGQGTAPVNGRCDIYASIAVAQQRANRAQSCGLQGPMWDQRYGYHYDWCLGAPEADRRAGTAARQELLDRCRP